MGSSLFNADQDRPGLGIAIVGLGRWGPNLLRCLCDEPRCRVLYAVDLDKARLSQVSQRYSSVTATNSLGLVLDDPKVNAVVIATPASSHFSICQRSLRAGKHCLVEKPLATSLQQASALVAEAEAMGLVLAVGHVFLYNPSIRKVKDYIARGTLGAIHYLNMVRTNLGPPGIDVDVVWDLATHDISVANYWLGSSPHRVTANGGAWVDPDQIDSVFATLEYPAGEIAHLVASWLNPRKVRDIIVVGSRFMITVDDMSPSEPLRVYDKGIDTTTAGEFVDTYEGFRSSIRDGDVHIPKIEGAEPLREECRDFVTSVLSPCAPVSSGRAALPVVATIEAIHQSLVEHLTVTLVP